MTRKLKAKKRFGQHFLTSKSALSAIIDAASITPGETVLEIGPGRGVLTEVLLESGAKVIAIEKDRDLIPYLKDTFVRYIVQNKLKIVEKDIRDTDVPTLGLKNSEYKLVANIPYYITGEIIRKFLETDAQPTRIVLLVQDEVAKRIARSKKESLLSLSVKVYGAPRYVKKIPRGAFSPSPKVDSAILLIENISKKNFSEISEKKFFHLLHAGFAHKRKLLVSNLSSITAIEIVRDTFQKLQISERARAEDLSLSEWLSLSNQIAK